MEPLVTRVAAGYLRGSKKYAIDGKLFYAFEGVPFAEPPLGPLRFKAPIPHKPWDGIKDALFRKPPNYCQVPKTHETGEREYATEGTEDCLNLNVFTPSLPQHEACSKPVIVFIHGGVFLGGETRKYGPEVIMTEDVVLVTTSYRVGVFGFLCIDDPTLGATGNAGIKDMVLALKWVQENIRAFNGDPNNVTLMGESAGAASTHILVLSPATKGLFHKAIIQSGSALNHWVRGDSQNAFVLARKLKCTATSHKEILEFLQELPADVLYEGMLSLTEKIRPCRPSLFAPVLENPNAPDAILTEEPLDTLKSGTYNPIPIIFGFNNDEGLIYRNPMLRNFAKKEIEMEDVLPHTLNLEFGSEEYVKLAEKVKDFYGVVDDGRTSAGVLSDNGIKLVSGNCFTRDVIRSAKLHAASSKEAIYLYKLSVSTKLAYLTRGKSRTVSHADGLGYQFLLPNTPSVDEGSIEDISRKRIVKLFTNFAASGSPNSEEDLDLIPIRWDPMKNGEVKVLDIGVNLSMENDPNSEEMAFWDEIFDGANQ